MKYCYSKNPCFCRGRKENGGVLLEVLMALALIVGASAVVTGGLQSAITSVDRMRNDVQGVNLAITVLSQIQMGIIPIESVESEDFESPFEGWSYDIVVEEVEDMNMSLNMNGSGESNGVELVKVQVAIRKPDGDVIKRMTQLLQNSETDSELNSYSTSSSISAGSEGAVFYGN